MTKLGLSTDVVDGGSDDDADLPPPLAEVEGVANKASKMEGVGQVLFLP